MHGSVGILGGTFDPIHHAHLAIAEEARTSLRLDRVLVIPAGHQPLKGGQHAASAEQRFTMARLACATNPALEVLPIEVERAGPSYTAITLEALAAQGFKQMYLIMGADALVAFDRWYAPERILAVATIVGVERPGNHYDLSRILGLFPQMHERLIRLAGPHLEVSSSELRERVAHGKSIRYLTPDPVVTYIAEQGLYRA